MPTPYIASPRSPSIDERAPLLDHGSTSESNAPRHTIGNMINAPFRLHAGQRATTFEAPKTPGEQAYVALAKEVLAQGGDIFKKNTLGTIVGNTFDTGSRKVANVQGMLHRAFVAPYSIKLDQLPEGQTDNHFEWVHSKTNELLDILESQIPEMNRFDVQAKLMTLIARCPSVATLLENATMSTATAVLRSPVASRPAINILQTIDSLHDEMETLSRDSNPKNNKELRQHDKRIREALEENVNKLQATGNVFGKISSKIKENPANNSELLDHTLARRMSKGNQLEFSEPVIYGVIKPNNDSPKVEKQLVLDNLLTAADLNVTGCQPNTPIVVRISGHKETFKEQVMNPFRECLRVTTKVNVTTPAGETKKIDLKTAPFIQTLENIICGNYKAVHKDVLDLIDDKADIFTISCSSNPEVSQALHKQLNQPATATILQSLKRTMVARLLLPAMTLEGTDLAETARNLAIPTVAGVVVDVGKNFIPDQLGALKTILMQVFFFGVDAADNLAGALPEIQSVLDTLGIEDISYTAVFNEPQPASEREEVLEYIKLALWRRSADGEAGPAVAAGLRSAVLGTVAGNLLTTGYTLGIGALDLNPAMRALTGFPAIMGTSLGIAINFAAQHADISLGYKQQIEDGRMGVDEAIKSNPEKLNAHCSDLALKQLMLLSGTGPGAQAFTSAPFTSAVSLLGYAFSPKVVDAVFTPLMPGMENLVRLHAMSQHGDKVEGALEKIDEKVIAQAAKGEKATISSKEFESMIYGDKTAARVTLAVGSLFLALLGKRHHHTALILPSAPSVVSTNTSA